MEQAQQQIAPLSVSVEESARILGISRSATYELIAQGEIKTFKIGRRRLALASELKAFIERAAKAGAR
ncbi:MAG: DNA-binding protein [Pseudomonas protegens]|uniref:helix-turn-helix domain-containing protein n=1 Tax=Pseudomonas chlororaphis TaxID=587753 RepID=UPI000DB092D5|nr:helix-turn-helix domain-containing protein [Pseudomonas chlororaphis]AZE37692.1 excisionase, putative [Pseudomonas chlororaphis subsp. aureofaciens]PZP02863.1 MAG: DNA-binding protein [Pseudomonas protegens]